MHGGGYFSGKIGASDRFHNGFTPGLIGDVVLKQGGSPFGPVPSDM